LVNKKGIGGYNHDDAFYFKQGKMIRKPLAWDDIQQAIFAIDELKSELEKSRAEVRRLNALLAYTGVNSRG